MVYVSQVYVPGQDDAAPATSAPAPAPAASYRPVAQAVPYYTAPPASAPTAPSAPPAYLATAPPKKNSLPASVHSAQYPSHYAAPPKKNSLPTSVHSAQYPSHYPSAASTAPVQYSPYPAPASAQANPTPASAPLPDFSQALDLPPPTIASTASVPPASSTKPDFYNHSRPVNGSSSYNSSKPGNGYPGNGNYTDSGKSNNTSNTVNGVVVSEGNPTQCHKVDYKIIGNDMQFVEVELDPDETVIAEAGAMMFLEDDVDFKVKLGDGSNPSQGFFGSLFTGIGRLITGESLFLTHFSNRSAHEKRRVAFAAPYPGCIVPVNMQNIGGKLICQKDAFLCAAYGTKVAIQFNKRLGSGFFGGEGFILQRLEGDGMAFIHAGGTIVKKELNGERLRLDTGCLVAFTSGIDFNVEFVPGLKSILFGGEGLFLATLQGHGTVWLQSLPFSRLADRILANAPSAGGQRTGEGNNLTGGLGDLIDGDGFNGWG